MQRKGFEATCGVSRYMGEDGEMRRPWCPATRILEHRETHLMKEKAERDGRRCTGGVPGRSSKQPRTEFPALKACPKPAYMQEMFRGVVPCDLWRCIRSTFSSTSGLLEGTPLPWDHLCLHDAVRLEKSPNLITVPYGRC